MIENYDVFKLVALVKSIRKEKGLTQVQMAKRLGWSQPVYNVFEQNKRKLTLDDVADICLALEISPKEFTRRYSKMQLNTYFKWEVK
jgi:transcriptional regulator with XRE-family HTH domain